MFRRSLLQSLLVELLSVMMAVMVSMYHGHFLLFRCKTHML